METYVIQVRPEVEMQLVVRSVVGLFEILDVLLKGPNEDQ